MASGQVVRPEHCGPMALPPCTTSYKPLPEQPGIGASPLTHARRNNPYEHCQNNTTNRPEAILPVLASRYGTIDGHRVHALDPCDVAVREAVVVHDGPTRRGRWPSPRRPRAGSPTPLSVATPDGPTSARCGAWTPGGGPPRLTTPRWPSTSASSSRRAARRPAARGRARRDSRHRRPAPHGRPGRRIPHHGATPGPTRRRDRLVQDGGDSTEGPVAHPRGRGVRHLDVGGLVQHTTTVGAARGHSTSRVRGAVL